MLTKRVQIKVMQSVFPSKEMVSYSISTGNPHTGQIKRLNRIYLPIIGQYSDPVIASADLPENEMGEEGL